MGLDFLRNHGACRVRDDDPHPLLLDDGATLTDPEDEGVDRTYEVPEADWRPRDTGRAAADADWSYRPRCFVDGKDVGRMVAWLQSREGYPVPVRLSEIGAAVVREENGILTREFALVERVVSLMGDLFPGRRSSSSPSRCKSESSACCCPSLRKTAGRTISSGCARRPRTVPTTR